MAFDQKLGERIRSILSDLTEFEEKKMFGGLCFMVQNYMCCGITKEDLMVRVGPDHYEKALDHPHARIMDFTGRPLRGYVYVDEGGLVSDKELEAWVNKGITFVNTLPPK